METNEQRKKAVRAAIQEELDRFFAQVQELSEGDLEHLEEQVVKTSQQMGRSLLEGILAVGCVNSVRWPGARGGAAMASGW